MREKPSEPREEILYGVHPVLEALEMRRRSVERILVSREGGTVKLGKVLRAARDAGVPITHLPREILAKKAGARAVHQGVAAIVSAIAYAESEEMCLAAAALPEALLVAVHQVEDPRNFGAILRTAAAAGCRGVLVGGEGMVGLTPTVAKTSAGAIERIAVAREAKLPVRLLWLQERGFRLVALDPKGAETWDSGELPGRLVVMIGGEARGLSSRLLEIADRRVRIPLAPGVESLNVSVALGVVLFEAVRQDRHRRSGSPNEYSVPRS